MDEDHGSTTEEKVLEFGSKNCVCPKCGIVIPHAERGIPCSSRRCPECDTVMKGEQCR